MAKQEIKNVEEMKVDQLKVDQLKKELTNEYEYESKTISKWPIAALRAMLSTEREKAALAKKVKSGGPKMTTFEKSVRDGLKGESVQSKTIASVIPAILNGTEDNFEIEENHGSAKLTLSVAIKVVAYLADNGINVTENQALTERIEAIKKNL